MWFFFALMCTLAWGTADLFYKKGNDSAETSTHLRTLITVGFAMGLYATYLLFVQKIQFDPVNFLIYLPVSLCYIVSMAVGYFGLRYLELSISSPIQNSSGAVAAILCMVLLKEFPDWLSAIGIVAVCIGVVYLGVIERRESASEIQQADKRYVSSFKALIFPLGYCIIDSLGTFLDAYYLDDVMTTPLRNVTEANIEDVANIAYLYTFLVVGVVCLIILLARKEKLVLPGTKNRTIAAIFETAGQAVYVYAMSGNGVVAAPMISAYCIVSLILSRIFLKEKLGWQKYVAIGIVVVGILLMGIAEGLLEA